jgi:hypothetical protein
MNRRRYNIMQRTIALRNSFVQIVSFGNEASRMDNLRTCPSPSVFEVSVPRAKATLVGACDGPWFNSSLPKTRMLRFKSYQSR